MENQCKREKEELKKQNKMHYRTSRFFCANGEWFFSTREGDHIGPYSSKLEAGAGAERYIEHMKKTNNRGLEHALQIAKEGSWRANNYC